MELQELNNISNLKIQNILNLLEQYPKYCDENNRAHIYIDNTDYLLSNKLLKDEIYNLCYENNLDINTTILNKVISILSNKIRKTGNKLELNYRIAKDKDGNFLYQLTKDEMVVINDKGYTISPITQPIFKNNATVKNQVKPMKIKNNTSLDNILDLFNLTANERFLMKAYIISLFIPDISKSYLVLIAEKGSGKTTIATAIKNIVDPSSSNIIDIKKNSEFSRSLSNTYLKILDNIDGLTKEQSNILCRAITGDAYEIINQDDILLNTFKSAVIMTGINCPPFRDDLLDRCIPLVPKRIKDFKSIQEIEEIIKKELPFALDYIFESISQARIIKSSMPYTLTKDRLVDWNNWIYCIGEVIEYNGGDRVHSILKQIRDSKTETIIDNNPVAKALKDYVVNGGLFIGEPKEFTSTELYNILKTVAFDNGYDKYFPKDVQWTIRKLNSLTGTLEQIGIIVEPCRNSIANGIKLTRIPKE